MDREIKFRGWSISQNRWVYGYLVKGTETIFIVYDAYDEDYKYASENVFIPVTPESVSQYTGLKDKKEVEIYEGDIISSGNGEIFFDRQRAQFRVRWHDPIWLNIRGSNQAYQNGEPIFANHTIVFEVIGNIHQHKHLLNG